MPFASVSGSLRLTPAWLVYLVACIQFRISGVRRLPKVTRFIASYTVRPYTPTSTKLDSSLRKNMEGPAQDMAVSHSPPQERANPSPISVLSPLTDSKDKGPVPMSFPSVLRNSGLTSHYARLVDPVQPKKVWRRNDNDGKRWVRRRENGASHLILQRIRLSLPSPLPLNKNQTAVGFN